MVSQLRFAGVAGIEQVKCVPAALRVITPREAEVRVDQLVFTQIDAGACNVGDGGAGFFQLFPDHGSEPDNLVDRFVAGRLLWAVLTGERRRKSAQQRQQENGYSSHGTTPL